MLNSRIWLSLRGDARVRDVRGATRVSWSRASIAFPGLPPGIREAVDRLSAGASHGDLVGCVADVEGDAGVAGWYVMLAQLERLGAVTYEARQRDRAVARLQAMAPSFAPNTAAAAANARWLISRFAMIRRQGTEIVVESGLTAGKVHVLDAAALAVLGALATPSTASGIAKKTSLSRELVEDVVELLAYSNLAVRARSDGSTAEDDPESLGTWQYADMFFHARSRRGRHDDPIKRFAFRDRVAPEPAIKPAMSDCPIALPTPDLNAITSHDPSFTRVLESRRSVRGYAREPITREQLGEFLFRAARVKRMIEADGVRLPYQASRRPYPGGGACYELEIYVVVNRCEGLEPGIYHYDPLHHHLEPIRDSARHVPTLVRDTLVPEHAFGPRQVVFTITARFKRIAWKYNGSSYASILKDVGVLFQTFYLVATAMRLAPCGLGNGNAEQFARITGIPFHEEGSVGEFMLGSLPADDATS